MLTFRYKNHKIQKNVFNNFFFKCLKNFLNNLLGKKEIIEKNIV